MDVLTAARELRRRHAGALSKMKGGWRALHRTVEWPAGNSLHYAHAKLDKAVFAATLDPVSKGEV